MVDSFSLSIEMTSPHVSPYLLRPLRTREQALADIAARQVPEQTRNVTVFSNHPIVLDHRAWREIAA